MMIESTKQTNKQSGQKSLLGNKIQFVEIIPTQGFPVFFEVQKRLQIKE